ncbi:MAG: gamma-glutamyl-gamma-aminobutyrate hydrolase family protein [Anaerolineae bacterium]|nr:gamma-glutamyl-gamma-aminobutyrate hydrolase family protein [Anaerolineae bacterium]
MKIAISMNIHQKKEPFDFLRHAYVAYFQNMGLLPVLVPNAIADPVGYVTALGVDAIVLPGGGDIAPHRYNQEPASAQSVSELRDQTEASLMQLAVEHRLPVIAICRGMQFVNVFFGGGLVQDIPTTIPGALDHTTEGGTHPVTISDERIAGVLGRHHITVNTHHHQAVTGDTISPVLDVFAVSEADGVIEGVLHPTLPILGVQWHPERPSPSIDTDLVLIRAALNRAFWTTS